MTVETSFGKITASKKVLSALICVLIDAAEKNTERGLVHTAAEQSNVRRQIFDALDKVGYYDNVKVGCV